MRTIIPYTDNPILREIAREVPLRDINSAFIRKLIADMKYLLAQEKYGVALAAGQVGEPIRVFIVSGRALAQDANTTNEDGIANTSPTTPPDLVCINPEIVKLSRSKKQKHEGCLSIKGKWGYVPRAEKATIRAYDEHGVLFTRGASGLLAHIFQHEMDHLQGVLYIDKAKKLYDDEK
jgi:peptide deformylase